VCLIFLFFISTKIDISFANTKVLYIFYNLQQKGRYDIQHNNTQHDDIQHNDTQHDNIQQNDTWHKNIQHNETEHEDIKNN